MKKLLVATACVLGIGTVVHLFSKNERAEPIAPEELTPDQQRYCEKVEQWRREEMLDVAPKWRLGHPDEQGTYTLWCTDR